MTTEKSCGAVLFNKNDDLKFLLLHYEAGHWDFPKGNQEEGESDKETVLREIQEETAITDVNFIAGFQDNINYYYTFKNDTINKTVIYFLAKTSQDSVVLSHEHIGYIWLSFEKSLKRLTFDNSKELLKKVYIFLKQENLL
tara:strand:- start:2485 stop:2907 length:423 start_codon:yes stop_codon:yes gene_type:complete